MHDFQYHLEKNLYGLSRDLRLGRYQHGGYRKYIVNDKKRREISVALVRDRVVHRLIYDYLVKIYDKTFIYDAWSCRQGKGLLGAVERTQAFLKPFKWVWKSDVKKFFDSVDQETLLQILSLRVKDNLTLNLLKELIYSCATVPGKKVGMPIGNLTSQIFANVYLNELDRFVKHTMKIKAYLRYGDDFIVGDNDLGKLKLFRERTIEFLNNELKLQVNLKSDRIVKTGQGLKFLGMALWPSGRTLSRRNIVRTRERLKPENIPSYSGLIKKHGNLKQIKLFDWLVYEKLPGLEL